jgi:carbonic anhydrase
MQQVSDGKVTGVAVFLKAGSTNATIQKLWQGMPNTPGKEQEVVGVKVIPAASCTARSRRCLWFAKTSAETQNGAVLGGVGK